MVWVFIFNIIQIIYNYQKRLSGCWKHFITKPQLFWFWDATVLDCGCGLKILFFNAGKPKNGGKVFENQNEEVFLYCHYITFYGYNKNAGDPLIGVISSLGDFVWAAN